MICNNKYKQGYLIMKTFKLSKFMPWGPHDLFDLIMDVDAYPDIYPIVKAARTVWKRPGYTDIEMDFNLAAGGLLKNPSMGMRVTSQPPYKIEVSRTKGQIDHLKMGWTLNPVCDDGTDMDFYIEYETGMGGIVDHLAFAKIKGIVGDTLTRFEQYAAKKMAEKLEETAMVDPEPVSRREKKRWKGQRPEEP